MKRDKELLSQLDATIVNGDYLFNVIEKIKNKRNPLLRTDIDYLLSVHSAFKSNDIELNDEKMQSAIGELSGALSSLFDFVCRKIFVSHEDPNCYTWKKDRYASPEEYDREEEYIREVLAELCSNVMGAYKNFKVEEKRLIEKDGDKSANNITVVGNNNTINAQNMNSNQVISNKKTKTNIKLSKLIGISVTLGIISAALAISVTFVKCNLSHFDGMNQNNGIQQGNSQGNIYNGDVINNYGPINQEN